MGTAVDALPQTGHPAGPRPEKDKWARGSLGVYLAYVRVSFLGILAYRMRYYTGIVTYVLFVSVHYFIWKAVYSGFPQGHRIHEFTLEQMITYIAVGWIARSLYFSNIDEQIEEYVRSGEISAYLIRPVNFHFLMLSQAAGETLFRLLFFTAPIACVILLFYPVKPPADLLHAVFFLLATICSFFVFAEINFLVGLLAFAWKSIDGVMRAKYFLVQLLSGLLIPLPFFPGWLSSALAYSPLAIISYLPLKVYLGVLSPRETLLAFVQMLLWVTILMLASQWCWKRVVQKLTVQGG